VEGEIPVTLANEAAIPDMHWLTDPKLAAVKGMFLMKTNYLTAIDNLLDDTHLPFVHRNSIGTPKMVGAPIGIEGGDDWVAFTRWTLDTPPSAMHAKAGGFTTNVAFHQRLASHPDFIAGRYDTSFIETHEKDLLAGAINGANDPSMAVAIAIATARKEAKMRAEAEPGAATLAPWVAAHRRNLFGRR